MERINELWRALLWDGVLLGGALSFFMISREELLCMKII